MVIVQRTAAPGRAPSHPVLRRPRPHWGYLSRSVGRYGVVSSVLVIYSPDASEHDRRRADLSRVYPPIAGGTALIAWIGLSAAGLPLLPSALVLAVLVIPLGILLAVRSGPTRHAAATVWSCTPLLGEDDEQASGRRRLDALADTIQAASLAYRRREIDPDRFERIWRSVHLHAMASAPAPRWVEVRPSVR
ncbi:DUF6611 family protein [Microbacterium panaciterrae]|uniref:Uncharacterized protein n=1 Tax=Microbacterium panaciterrae TaxID=985759 RepID=A0ABP8P4H1_9MICO